MMDIKYAAVSDNINYLACIFQLINIFIDFLYLYHFWEKNQNKEIWIESSFILDGCSPIEGYWLERKAGKGFLLNGQVWISLPNIVSSKQR